MNGYKLKKRIMLSKNEGFSLLEVLLAIVLLAIIATPILSVFYTSMSLNIKSKEIMAATDVSTGIIECVEKADAKTFVEAAKNKNFNKYPFLNKIYVSGTSSCVVNSTENEIKFQNLKYKKNDSSANYIFDVIVRLSDVQHGTNTYWVKNVKVEVYKDNSSGETVFETANLCNISGSVINID